MRSLLKRFAATTGIVATVCVLTFTIGLLRADTVYVDGVKVEPPRVTEAQVTNIVQFLQLGAVFSSTGITNIWTGTQAEYDGIMVKDSKTLYFTKE